MELSFSFFHGAALNFIVDGKENYFYWNGIKKVPIIPQLTKGTHKIKCEIYPSDFSAYGLSNYIYGDTLLVPPAHFSGKRGLADPLDSPEITCWEYLNFRKLGIGQILLNKNN